MEEKNKQYNYYVYIHRNIINNKAYIGLTSRKPEKRWGKAGRCYRKNQPVFYRAIQKYGWNNFEHIIFADNLTKKQAIRMEKMLIALYKTNCNRYKNPEYGYNLTDGGEGTTGCVLSEETKQILSNKMRERMLDPEVRNHLSEKAKEQMSDPKMIELLRQLKIGRYDGANNPHYGKKHSDETKQKISEIAKIRLSNPKNNPSYGTGRHVVQLSISEEFIAEYISADEAGKINGVDRSSIRRCCNGSQRTAGGSKWMYKDQYEKAYNALD